MFLFHDVCLLKLFQSLQKCTCIDYDPGKHRIASEVYLYANPYSEERRGEILIGQILPDLFQTVSLDNYSIHLPLWLTLPISLFRV